MSRFEKPPNSDIPQGEFEMPGTEASNAETLSAVEESLKENIEAAAPKIPERERRLSQLTNSEGQQVGMIERLRRRQEQNNQEDLWLVADFDDFINHTTTFNDQLFARLSTAWYITGTAS